MSGRLSSGQPDAAASHADSHAADSHADSDADSDADSLDGHDGIVQRIKDAAAVHAAAITDQAAATAARLPHGSSHWDRLPAELHAITLALAGPLTRFLCGLLGTKRTLERTRDNTTVAAVWADAIALDWAGDLQLLPDTLLDTNNGMLRVRSRSLFCRLCARFPDQADFAADRRIDSEHNTLSVVHTRGPAVFTVHQQLRHIAMRNGWLDLLSIRCWFALAWHAVIYGHPALLRHLVDECDVRIAKMRAWDGFLAMDLAARGGHLEVLQMLHEAGSKACSTGAMDGAARGGHLQVVQWLHDNRTEGCTKDAIDWAAEHGHLSVVQWLATHRREGCTRLAMDYAAQNGHTDVAEWLDAAAADGGVVVAHVSNYDDDYPDEDEDQ